MSDERLECLMKSLLSQNFYWAMSDLSETLTLQPALWCNCQMGEYWLIIQSFNEQTVVHSWGHSHAQQ